MLSVLDEARKRLGDKVELRLARASYWARKGGDGAPAALAELETGADKFGDEALASLRRELAGSYARIGRPKDAERLWRDLEKQLPDDLNVRLTLFDLAVRAGDDKSARGALDEIRRIEGDRGTLWRFARAVLLLEQSRRTKDRKPLAEARADLEKVALQRPSWSRVPLVLAEIELADGRPESAIRDYLKAIVELGERDPAAIRRAAGLLGERQRFTEAELVLRKLRDERAPLSGEMQRLAAQVAFRNQDYASALEQAEKVVSDRSEDYRELIWLGQLRWAAGKPAEPAFRRAVVLAGDAPEARLALITYLAGTDRKAEAEKALAEAEKALPPETAALALARANAVLGRTDRARELYRKAQADRPADLRGRRGAATFYLGANAPAEAEPLLERIIDLGGAATDVAWARRVLASVMAARGDHRRTLRALEILGLSGDAGSPGSMGDRASPDDLRTKARILARQPTRTSRREAAGLLEGLIERRVARPDDLYLLAQLADADGDWPKARQRYLDVVNGPAGAAYLAPYIRALLRHGQVDEAKLALVKLEAAAPKLPALVELKARVLRADRRGEEAAALLDRFAGEDEARVLPAARLSEEIGQAAEAEKLFRRAADKADPKRPEPVLALAGFLSRHGRLADAVDLLEKRAWGTYPAPLVSNAALTILYAAGAGNSTLHERVARRIEEASGKDPSAISIRFDLANARALQGRYAEAEAILRDVHERNKALGAPLNNLAWIKVLRGDTSGEALRLIEQAIQLEGETPDLLDTLGVAELAQNRVDRAVHDLEDAIAVSPTPDKYLHLSRAYLAAGRRTDAEQAFREAETRGLTPEMVHPLEQEAYRQIVAAFAKK